MFWIMVATSFMELVPFLIAVYFFKHLGDPLARVFIFYLAITLVIEIVGTSLAYRGTGNHVLYNSYVLVSALFNAYIYFSTSLRHKFLPVIMLALVAVSFFLLDPFVFNKVNYFIVYSFQGVMACYLLISLIDQYEDHLTGSFRFWLYSGMLIYGFSTLIIYFMFDYILIKNSWGYNYYIIYNLFISIITNLAFSKGLLCQRKKQISS